MDLIAVDIVEIGAWRISRGNQRSAAVALDYLAEVIDAVIYLFLSTCKLRCQH